jgi:ankyrin repeat protein
MLFKFLLRGLRWSLAGVAIIVGLAMPIQASPQNDGNNYRRDLRQPLDEQMIQAAQYGDLATMRELLSRGVSPDLRGYGSQSVLMLALNSVYGRKAVFLLLASHADPNTKSDNGSPILMYAFNEDDVELANRLLDLGADIRLPNAQGNTPLHAAVGNTSNGRPKPFRSLLAERLLRGGADINAPGEEGRTPLMTAVFMRNQAAARFLLAHHADVMRTDRRGETVLSYAVGWRNVELIRLLMAQGAYPADLPLNTLDSNGFTRLMMAVFARDAEQVRALLKRGADPNVRGFYKATALCFAVETGDPEIPRLLLDADADVNAQAELGQTPLVFATQNHKQEPTELVRLLLDRGAKVTLPVQSPFSAPLLNVVQLGHLQVAALLVEHGADIHTRNRDGRTLLQIAVAARQAGMVRDLLRRGLDVNALAPNGDPILFQCAQKDAFEVVHALIEGGANIEIANREGKTPLRVAAGSAEEDIFEILLAAGADPASKANDGTTVVMAAARSGSVPILRRLLARRVDVDAQDKNGYTALMHAAHEGMAQTVALLLTHGANPALRAVDGSTALDVSRLYRYPGHVAAAALLEKALASPK